MSLETREIKIIWRDIPGFWWDIPAVPEEFESSTLGPYHIIIYCNLLKLSAYTPWIFEAPRFACTLFSSGTKKTTNSNLLGTEIAGWGGAPVREGTEVKKFVPSFESLFVWVSRKEIGVSWEIGWNVPDP